MKLPAIIFFLLFTASAAAAVYKCPNSAGKIEYSDKPCADGQTVNVSGNSGNDAAAGPIRIGMSKHQVQSIWGNPKDTTMTSSYEQWTYSRDGRNHYIYFDNDKVSRVSSYDSPSSGALTAKETNSAAPRQMTTREREAQEREEKAGNRTGIGRDMSEDTVRSKLGEPEKRDWWQGLECWYYSPTAKDYQTRSRICFSRAGRVVSVDRTVER